MRQLWIEIDEVETADVSTESVYGGEINIADLEVSKLPKPGIKEADDSVTSTIVSGGAVEKPEELEKSVIAPQNESFFDGGKRFNQVVIAIFLLIICTMVFPAVCIFVIVAVNDIYHGRLDLEKYFSLLIALVYGLGTFLAGLGIGSFVKKPKINSG